MANHRMLGTAVDDVHRAVVEAGFTPWQITVHYRDSSGEIDVFTGARLAVWQAAQVLAELGAELDAINVSGPYGRDGTQVNVSADIPRIRCTVRVIAHRPTGAPS